MTTWLFRSILIVAAEDLERARAVAVMVGDGGEVERASFTIGLSIDGSSPATHYLADSPVKIDMLRRMLPSLELEIIPSLRFYRTRLDVLVDTNSSSATRGEPFTWVDAIADCGLVRVADVLYG